jgi:hypothetical protein
MATRDLFQTVLPKGFTVDHDKITQAAHFIHVVRATHFSAAIRDRQSNLGEPKNLPSGWPILYNSFFEAVRADVFQYSCVDIRRAS